MVVRVQGRLLRSTGVFIIVDRAMLLHEKSEFAEIVDLLRM